MKTSLRLLALVALALLVSLEAFAASPLSGTWSGSGVVVPDDGQKEAVRCRISYSQQSSTIYGVDVKCTSTSSKQIRQAGQLRQISATQFVGRFSSTKHKVAGQVTVTLKGSSVQTVTFDSNRGQASVTLKKL
jgi:ABC-type iron transport system FetAB ATPase subunit